MTISVYEYNLVTIELDTKGLVVLEQHVCDGKSIPYYIDCSANHSTREIVIDIHVYLTHIVQSLEIESDEEYPELPKNRLLLDSESIDGYLVQFTNEPTYSQSVRDPNNGVCR